MGTYDVSLPANQRAVFPPRCVVCEKPNPDGTIKLSFLGVKTGSAMEMVIDKAVFDEVDPRYYGSNTSNKIDGIPACKRCASGLKWYHRFLKFGYYTAWIPGLVPIVLGMSTIISVPFMILCAISPGVFTLVFPPSFGASFIDGMANFEFKSLTTAQEFLQLNSDAKLKSKAPKTETNAVSPNEAGN